MSSGDVVRSPTFDTPNNHGPLINVLAWFFAAAGSLTVFTRLGTKWVVNHKVDLDDGLIITALLCSVGQTVAVSLQVANGLGQHIDTISTKQQDLFQKLLYTGNLLWLAAQCFSKLSVIALIRSISPAAFNQNATLGFIIVTILWGGTSTTVLLFQCHGPRFWNFLLLHNTCINLDAFWSYLNVVNIILELTLIILPIAVVWNLRVSLRRKLVFTSCFGSRILSIAAVIFQMVVSVNVRTVPDATFTYWLITIAMTLVQCMGIVTACVPYLKPFWDGLETGMIRTDNLHGLGYVSGSLAYSYGYGKETAPASAASASRSGVGNSIESSQHELAPMKLGPHIPTVATVVARNEKHIEGEWDAESHSSRTKIITQTRTWRVDKDRVE